MIHHCEAGDCPVRTPRRLCYFHAKPPTEPTKACLRCRESQPLSHFAYAGRCALCDSCRWISPMTHFERRQAHSMSPYYQRRRRLRKAA